MGMEYEQDYGELPLLVKKYNNNFGSVYYWEYNYAKPSPLEWLKNIETIYNEYEHYKNEELFTECNIS